MRVAAVVLASLLASVAGCIDNGPELPKDNPGVPVPGVSISCGYTLGECLLWSADSKTLYAVSYLGQAGFGLVAIDPETLASRRIGTIDAAAHLEPSHDGSAVFFSAAPPGRSFYRIYRYRLDDANAEQLVDSASSASFRVSADGNRIFYHTPGSTPYTDTVAVHDIAAHARVGSAVVDNARLADVSPDGSQMVFIPIFSSTPFIWNVASSTYASLQMPTLEKVGYLADIRWVNGSLRGLFLPLGDNSTPKDVRFGSVDTATYWARPSIREVQIPMEWLPSVPGLFIATREPTCSGSSDCGVAHFEIAYTSPTTSVTIGSVNAWLFTGFAPSPDGKWLAYKVLDQPLRLISR